MQALDAGLAQRLGLAQLGAAHAQRAGRDLAARDVGRLVGLGMRPQLHIVRLGEGRHLGDVAVEHLEIEHQRRRVERAPRALLADQMAVEFLGFAHVFCLQVAHDHGLAGRAAVHARAFHESVVPARAPKRNALRQQAAIDLDRLAGDEAGLVGAQERGHVGDDVGLAAVGPRLLGELLLVLLRPAAMDQRRRDHAGRDADDADAVGAELGRDVLDQADDGGLGRRIGVAAAAAHHAGDRGRDQDDAAITVLLHGQRGVLHAEEHRAGQHGEGVVPVLDAGLGDRPEGAADAGIEIGDVEPAEALLGLGDHGRDVGLLGDVAAHEGDAVAMALRLGDRQRLGAVGLVEVGHHHLRAVGQEAHDRRAAHAARPAGDDRHLACQSVHVISPFDVSPSDPMVLLRRPARQA